MKRLFSSPTIDDLILLLKAWRFWSLGALVGALLGGAVYMVAPPPYRAHAVVLVDFNLEQAWPQDTDRQQFYYLERESRKLEEIARSDTVIKSIVEADQNVTAEELRNGMLFLSQPAEGGWNFYVDDKDPQRAASIDSLWVQAFVTEVRTQVAGATGLNSFIEVTLTQNSEIPAERNISLSVYLFVGALAFLAVGSLVVLFISRSPSSTVLLPVGEGSR